MGFALFESSGTFNPLDYGLNVGDMLNVVVVGGGAGGYGAGNSNTPAGSAGTASSYGDLITAAGGSGSYGNAMTFHNSSSAGSYWYAIGGQGQNGWTNTPYINDTAMSDMAAIMACSDSRSSSETTTLHFVNGGARDKAGNGTCQARTSSTYSTFSSGGYGGLGYGAGGGGGTNLYPNNQSYSHAGHGGAAGKIVKSTFSLTSTSSVTITVGTGGSGGSDSGRGGKGADGCVAIFW